MSAISNNTNRPQTAPAYVKLPELDRCMICTQEIAGHKFAEISNSGNGNRKQYICSLPCFKTYMKPPLQLNSLLKEKK